MSDDVKSLKIGGIDPSEENIANGKYELQTPFLFITSKNPSKEVKEFLVWIKSPKAIEIIKSKKIVPTI
jgi:phosphate transport system substrate-binding protein